LALPGLLALRVHAQDLTIGSGDLRIEQHADGGFHLYIRKKPAVNSVLLVESSRDPSLREDNYAYRAGEWNAVNGDEPRILDGAPIPRENRIYSIIDSSPEDHPEMGPAFHLYIPYILHYGYENTRHGEVYVVDGTWFNIRAFALPYADYRGPFLDNPYVLRITQREGPPEGSYMKDTEDAFREIADSGNGELVHAAGPGDLVERMRDILEKERGRQVDIVLCLDTTSSMKDDIDEVRRALIPMLREIVSGFSSFRIGMVLYKDYFEEYLNRVVPFTRDFGEFQNRLNAIRVSGGRDLPEAVYEALYEAAVKFDWEAERKFIILVGDAPPHPRQRGKISKEMVDGEVNSRNLRVHAIILPQ
jgi:Mg-chelatase subunit ChlD